MNTKFGEVLVQPKITQEVENLADCYQILGEAVESWNNIFGQQMLLIMFHSGLQGVHCLN